MLELKTPLRREDVESLKVGDVVYLSGTIFTSRDRTQLKVIEMIRKGLSFPISLAGLVEYHAGPVIKRTKNGWNILSVGPTTSFRMEKYEAEFIELTKIKGIIGKGGMGKLTEEACKKNKVFYGIYPGGAGALAAKSIKNVKDSYFLQELGIPEAMWVLEVEKFGPIVVAIDSFGNNIYDEIKRKMIKGEKNEK
ncbi:MAG: FumA C-terminus/TtdB family hydratase beta subunit [Thermoproteota archaeon]|nr:fumarate hydratase C-terminal domain-containing protein [Candidatus Brockarchaeota archaeon]